MISACFSKLRLPVLRYKIICRNSLQKTVQYFHKCWIWRIASFWIICCKTFVCSRFALFGDRVIAQTFPDKIYNLLCFFTTFGEFLFFVNQVSFFFFFFFFFFFEGRGLGVAVMHSLLDTRGIYCCLLSVHYLE